MKLWQKTLFAVISLIAVYALLYYYSLSQVQITAVDIGGIQEISLDGFSINGSVELKNAGIMPVSMDHIEYNVVLQATNQTLAKGYIEGGSLSPRESVRFPLQNNVSWAPTLDVALRLFDEGDSYVLVKGTAYIGPGMKLPFEQRVNLEAYLKQFLATQAADAGLKGIADGIIKGISDILR
jgi:hypothetical protein